MTTTIRHRYTTTKLLLLLLLMMVGVCETWGAHSYYTQNYESQSDASLWSSVNYPGGLSLVTGDATYGKYIKFAQSGDVLSGPRTAYTNFSISEWPYSSYTIEFDASLKTCNTSGHATELVVASEGYELAGNQYFADTNDDNNNFLFMLKSNGIANSTTYVINRTTDEVVIAADTWFHVKLVVDITNRQVNYTLTGGASASGTYNITDGTSMEAKALVATIGMGYYGSVTVDNINIYSIWYYLKTDIPTTLVSTGGAEGVTVTHPYPHYVLSGTTLYRYPSTGVNPNYGKTFTLTSTDNQVVSLTNDGTISNVADYREAEDFMMPVTGNNYLYIRCSNTQGAYANAYVDALTLPQGVYTLTTASYANSSTTFSFKVGNDVVFTHTGNGGWSETSSGNIQIPANTPVQVIGGSRNYGLDYVFAQAQFAYLPASGELAKGSNTTPTLVNNLSMEGHTVSYASSNQAVATVNASTGEITANHNGTAVITASYKIGGDVVNTATYTVTVTGETVGTYTLTTSPTTAETFTVTGAGRLPQTIDGTMMRLSFGADNEVQVVESVTGSTTTELGVRGIDINGFSHVYVPTDIPTMGSYFAITPKQNGVLSFKGFMLVANAIRLTDAEGNILERISASNVTANDWHDYNFGTLLNSGNTYYLFAETEFMTPHDSQSTPTLYLNNLTLTKTDGITINLIDQSLLFFPDNNGNNNQLDRSIPGFDIKFMGDGFKYESTKNFIVSYDANGPENNYMKITPRLASGASSDVEITGVTLLYTDATDDPNNPKVTIAGTEKPLGASDISCAWTGLTANDITITLTSGENTSFHLKAVSITYSLKNGATLNMSKQPVTLKFENDCLYGYEGDRIENKFWIDEPNAYYGDVTIVGNVSYYGSGYGFWNGNSHEVSKVKDDTDNKTYYRDVEANPDEEYKILMGQGVCVLEASTPETSYFAPGYTGIRLYSRDYVEERQPGHELTLAPGATYSVPAGGGYSFKVVTSGGSISLSNTAQSSTIAVEADKEYATTVSGGAGEEQTVTITNDGASTITIKRIEVSRKKPELDFGYRGAVGADGCVLFTGWNYTPNTFSITSETEADVASKYEPTGTYAIAQAVSGVSINASGVLTVSPEADNGVLKVTLTVNPLEANKADYAPLTKTIELKVVDGMWDFRTYSRDEHNTMYNSEGWGGLVGGYYAARDNAEFADILRNDGTPLPRALALQTKGKHRLLHTDHGYLHLQGQGSGSLYSANGGGQLLVPVKAGMLVEVNSYSEDLLSEMEIDGVTDLEGNDVTMFYVDPAPASQYFLAKSDGYVIVRNPSTNLDLHIKYIKVSAEMAFEYGNVTYIDATVGTWTNKVMNQGTTTIAYTYVNNINTPVTAIDPETGEVTIGTGAYGKFTVTATGSGTGVLAGKTNTYTAYAIGFSRNATSSSRTVSESNVFDLKTLFDVEVGNITSTEPAITAENLKDQITFSLVRQMPTVTLSGSTLTIEGVQTVTVKATLGAIEKTFTCEVTGGTLADGLNPVIANDVESYTITITGGDASSQKFKVKQMYDAIMGDLKTSASTLRFNGEDVSDKAADYTISSSTLTITGFSTIKKGGVIPIYASYDYSSTTYNIEGTLTVAYSSHTWDFQHNLLTVFDATHGYTGLGGWQTANGSGTAAWDLAYATIDQPTDVGVHDDAYDWKFVRKIGGHTEGSIVYYYNHSVEGNNALAIPETEGLRIFSSPSNKQLGVEMMQTGGVANVPYDCRNVMLLRGGKLIIPLLKKGQWVEVRWTRHKEEMGERIVMENLSDVEGTPITSTYKIANCYYDLPWSTSSYMFQATEDGNVSFEVADNIYVSIQQIVLHEPGWDFQSNFAEKLRGYDDVSYNKDIVDPSAPLYNKKYKDYTESEKSAWTGSTAPQIDWQYIWDDQNSHTITVLQKQYQNAPRAPQKWTFEMDDMLKRAGATMVATGEMDQEATVTYNGGWGKLKITMTSYSQNMKYVANQKSWTITFGQAPKQTYPYTWDFTKFFTNTLGSTTNDLTWAAVAYSGTANPLRVAIYNNHSSSNYGSGGWANSYNKADYESYYVEGAQLVSYGLRNTNNGVIRETAGLGFKLDTNADGQPDQNMLLLNMTNTVATPQQAVNGQTWITDTGETDADKHTGNSHLTIGSGGIIIVPKPNDADHYNDYYIYIKSSHKPTTTTNVTDCSSHAEVPTGVYKYQFSANANAEFTFTSDDQATDGQLGVYTTNATPDSYRNYTDIYAIAVTKDYKTVKRLNGVGWATESRSYAVDYTLNELLTTRPMQAYSVIARSSNPIYSVDKTKTTVRLQDRNYVVPAKQGLVLKQAENSPGADGSPYTVPLFVPAVTTAIEPDYSFTNNLMRPNLTETTFAYESENFNGSTYVRFILSDKYMTWRKEGDNAATYDANFVTGTVPGFYRMHVFSDIDYDSGTLTGSNRNTLAANKAYLLLSADNLNYPLWGGASLPARRFDFVGIEGVSDMEDITDNQDNLFDNGTYNLRGQKVNDDGPLPPGIYIRNGKKIIVK